MGEIRRELGKDYEGLLVESGAFASKEAAQVEFILHAAATYLAMRARFAPDYNGIDLASPQGWKAAMDAFAAFGGGGPAIAAGRSATPVGTRGGSRRRPAKAQAPRKAPAKATSAKRKRPRPTRR
jgi:hypothetical protein